MPGAAPSLNAKKGAPRPHLRAQRSKDTRRLAIDVGDDGALPTEFRLFTKGWNDSENGRYLFDEKAAAATMAAYAAWAVDLMIDLEHQALEEGAPVEPTARDARGWCRLELRDDGSLWAVDVKWTEDGAARLREKRQRYVSPAFGVNKETSRITSILNIAITAIPATHGTPALVAARALRDHRKLSAGHSFADIQCALSAALAERFPSEDPYGMDGGPWLVDVFDASCVYQLEGALYELGYEYDGAVATLGPTPTLVERSYTPAAATPAPSSPPAVPLAKNRKQPVAKLAATGGHAMDPKTIASALEIVANKDAKGALVMVQQMLASLMGAEPKPTETPAPPAEEEPAAAKADDKDLVAAARVAIALTGKTNPGEALAELARRSSVAVELESREVTLAADRAKLESSERRALVGTLVKLGVELPATAWSDDKGAVPVERLASEPIDALRSRVKLLSARGVKTPTDPTPPSGGGDDDAHNLDASQLAICKQLGCDPETFARLSRVVRPTGA